MSNFEVPVVRVDRVEDHPNADRLSLVYFKEYITISAKLDDGSHRYSPGDLVVYVPEGAVVPEYLLKEGFWNEKENKGFLAGSKGDRVKAIRLRGILSQGIMFPTVRNAWIETEEGALLVEEGEDVAYTLDITKYEPEIPASMSGDVVYVGTENVQKFDVENIKKYPDILVEGEDVVITEKLHGTMMGIGYVPGLYTNHKDLWGNFFCFSKGLGSKGMVFRNTEQNAQSNVYVKVMNKMIDRLQENEQMIDDANQPIYFFGEVFGRGIQDLDYGTENPEFRLFDVMHGRAGFGLWGDWSGVVAWAKFLDVETAPILYRGPYDNSLRSLKDGNSTLTNHIREGIVIKPTRSRSVQGFGRVILKDVSDAYLTRKNATEFN